MSASSMIQSGPWSRGDIVIHPRRPEWGEGTIEQASSISHEGQPAQRLVINFTNHGRAVINTGVAALVRKESLATMSTTSSSQRFPANAPSNPSELPDANKGWLGKLGQVKTGDELYRLPDSMTDPFLSLSKRLQATLDSYRFSTEPRALIDWAIAQTGLSDPLSKHSRPELEQAFPRFARDRENHLFELVRTLKRQNRMDILQTLLNETRLPAARNVLQKAIKS